MATKTKRDYYEILGIARGASDQEIKSAYRKLAMQHHPDRNPGDSTAEEKFKEASEAYSILSDANKRASYDRFGHAGVGNGAGGFNPADMPDFAEIFSDIFGFGEMFGQSRGGGRRSRAQRGGDLREDMQITFEEAAFGAKKTIHVRRSEICDACHGTGAAPGKQPVTCSTCHGQGQVRYQQGFFSIARTCPTCHGSGSVITDPCKKCKGEARVVVTREKEIKVPAGVEDGTRIRYAEDGEAGAFGGTAGDLYIVLHVAEHAFFEREGKDLHCAVPISFVQSALGTELHVPTLEGDVTIKVPEGTQTGTVFRVRGKGMPILNSHGKGDLFVRVKIDTPKKLTKRQRELLEELGQTFHIENKPQRASLLDKVKDIFG